MLIAHLSDIHVKWPRGQGGSWSQYLNKRVLGWLNLKLHRSHPLQILEAAIEDLRRDPPDHLVITGDFTNLALEAEFERACDYVEQIGLPAERVSVIPGNHDTYTAGSYRTRTFERVFKGFLDGSRPEEVWPRKQELGEVTIVSTTSSVPTPWFRAWGVMGEQQLERVGELLAGAEAPYRIVLVHHPPLRSDGSPDKRSHGNHDGAALLEVCRVGGVDLLLCGHIHRGYTYEDRSGPKPLRIVCAGSTTQQVEALGEGAAYNRYRIEAGKLVGTEIRGFDPTTRTFAVVS